MCTEATGYRTRVTSKIRLIMEQQDQTQAPSLTPALPILGEVDLTSNSSYKGIFSFSNFLENLKFTKNLSYFLR